MYIDAHNLAKVYMGKGKDKLRLATVINELELAPTVDVAEVKHGQWVNKGDYAVCTECGERSGTQYDGVEPIPLMTKFCSNCGAKMDESATDIFVGSRKE